jgi:hypothetical protein
MADTGRLIEITLTKDMFECQVLAEAVRAEGYIIELITDAGETGATLPTSASRLLIHESDVDAVKAILERSHRFN